MTREASPSDPPSTHLYVNVSMVPRSKASLGATMRVTSPSPFSPISWKYTVASVPAPRRALVWKSNCKHRNKQSSDVE